MAKKQGTVTVELDTKQVVSAFMLAAAKSLREDAESIACHTVVDMAVRSALERVAARLEAKARGEQR